jgi:hypothetical protein
VAAQVRVATNVLPPVTFVSVPTIEMVAVPHASVAVGWSNRKLPTPHSFVLLPAQVMEGAVVSMLAIVWLQVFVLPELSVATHVRVATKVLPHPRLVEVIKTETVTVPHVSLAFGSSNAKMPMPHSLVLFAAHAIDGRMVSTSAIVWLQVRALPQASAALQVRVATNVLPPVKFVSVPTTEMLANPQLSLAVGSSKVKLPRPHSLVLLAAQVIAGAVVSILAIVWLQLLVLPELSVATQVRVATKVIPQPRLVEVLKIETVTTPHVSPAFGSSNANVPTPHSLVLFPAQVIEGRVVSTSAIVWLHVLTLPQGSVAAQVRVATNVLPPVRFVIVSTIEIAGVPQESLATGSSKIKLPTPHSLVLLPAQLIAGAVVSTLAIVWLQIFVLPELSVATHVRIATNVLPQPRLVTVLTMETVTAPHVSLAAGSSNVNVPTPHSLVLFPVHVIEGLIVSTRAMV